MRIALVTETYPPEIGGAALSASRFVEALLDRGHQVQLVRPRQPEELLRPQSPGFETVLVRGIRAPFLPGFHYASADVFLFPSFTETFGNVVLEAMASGLAVVAFDEAAAGQHIRHGHDGLLAPVGREDLFLAHAQSLAAPGLVRRLGEAARRTASTLSWERVGERLEAELLDVVARAQPSPTNK